MKYTVFLASGTCHSLILAQITAAQGGQQAGGAQPVRNTPRPPLCASVFSSVKRGTGKIRLSPNWLASGITLQHFLKTRFPGSHSGPGRSESSRVRPGDLLCSQPALPTWTATIAPVTASQTPSEAINHKLKVGHVTDPDIKLHFGASPFINKSTHLLAARHSGRC